MDDLERQKAELTSRLAPTLADNPDVHPNIANLYRLRVERLTEALDDRTAAGLRRKPFFP